MDDFLTIDEAADLLGISSTAAYRLARNGEIPARKSGSDYQFRRADVEQYKQKQEQAGDQRSSRIKPGDLTGTAEKIICGACGDEIVSELSVAGRCPQTDKPICQACWHVSRVRQLAAEDKPDAPAKADWQVVEPPDLEEVSLSWLNDEEAQTLTATPRPQPADDDRPTVAIQKIVPEREAVSTDAEAAVEPSPEPQDTTDESAAESARDKPHDIDAIVEQLRAAGKPVITAANAWLAERTLVRNWGQRLGGVVALLDPISGESLELDKAKATHTLTPGIEQDTESRLPCNYISRFLIKAGSWLRTKAAIMLEARFLSRPDVLREQGYDAEPISRVELEAALVEIAQSIKGDRTFHLVLIGSPTGFDDDAAAMVTDRHSVRSFADERASIVLHDLHADRELLDETDDRLAGLLPMVAPRKFSDRVRSIADRLRETLDKRNSLSLSDAAAALGVDAATVRAASDKLRRDGGYLLDELDKIGLVISRATL